MTHNFVLSYVEGGSDDERREISAALVGVAYGGDYFGSIHAALRWMRPREWDLRCGQAPLLPGNPDSRVEVDAWELLAAALQKRGFVLEPRDTRTLALDAWSEEEPISYWVNGIDPPTIVGIDQSSGLWRIHRRSTENRSWERGPGIYENAFQALNALRT